MLIGDSVLRYYTKNYQINKKAFSKIDTIILKCLDILLAIAINILLIKFKDAFNYKLILGITGLRYTIQIFICNDKNLVGSLLNLHLIYLKQQKSIKQLIDISLVMAAIVSIMNLEDLFIISSLGLTIILIMLSYHQSQIVQVIINQDKKKKSKDFDVEALPYKQPSFEQRSPVYGGGSPFGNQNQSYSMDMMDEYAWIKGQHFIVLDELENVVIQTFSMMTLQKHSFSNSQEAENISSFLCLQIMSGNKDFQDLVSSSFFVNKQNFTIRELVQRISLDYELYKNNYFVITKVDAAWMQDCNIKIFLVAKNRKIYTFIQVEFKETTFQPNSSFQQINQFAQYITSSLNIIMTLSAIAEKDNQILEQTLEKFIYPIRIASIQIYLHLANLRDYNLHFQKRLMLRISSVKIYDIFDDIVILLQDGARARGTEIRFDVTYDSIETDQERLKQILMPLVKVFVKETRDGIINLNSQPVGQNSFQFTVLTTQILEERDIRSLKQILKRVSSTYTDLSVADILCGYISGKSKQYIQLDINEEGTFFTFMVQSYLVQVEEMKVIKLIGQNHYYETSLSQLLGQHSESSKPQEYYKDQTQTLKQQPSDSLHFSQSRISKQLSQRHSEYFSAYVSQISRAKGDSGTSKLNPHTNTNKQKEFSMDQISINNIESEAQKLFNTSPQQNYQLPHFIDGELRERQQTFLTQPPQQELAKPQSISSMMDFGSDTNGIQMPQSSAPKMQNSIMKFSALGDCCSRILVADSEFQNIQILELILSRFKVKITRAFTTEETLKCIENKKRCNCGNRGFVLYFINIDLPKKGGLWLSRYIKEKMNSELQKGYIIGSTGLVDYHKKLEYYRNGIDQYLSLPYDIAEVTSILKIIS